MRNTQYIAVGTADADKIESGYPALCLLTRRVFKTHKEAQAFIGDPSSGRHRTGQVVECYFPVPDSLYRQDWAEASKCAERETIDRAQSAGIVALGEEAASGHTLAEQIEMIASQRENARNAAAAYKAEAEELRAALEGLAGADSCTCETHHSWYGEDHCSACPCSWVPELLAKGGQR